MNFSETYRKHLNETNKKVGLYMENSDWRAFLAGLDSCETKRDFVDLAQNTLKFEDWNTMNDHWNDPPSKLRRYCKSVATYKIKQNDNLSNLQSIANNKAQELIDYLEYYVNKVMEFLKSSGADVSKILKLIITHWNRLLVVIHLIHLVPVYMFI